MKLKPCPCCNGVSDIIDHLIYDGMGMSGTGEYTIYKKGYSVICQECFMSTPCVDEQNEAVKIWNKRHIDEL